MHELSPAPRNTIGGRRLGGRLVVLLAALWTAVSPVRAQTPEEDLGVARDFFLIADYAAALDKVDVLLRHGSLGPAERIGALELEARCELALGRRIRAIDSFCTALRTSPAWRPDVAEYTDKEREAFAKAFDLCGPLETVVPRGEEEPAPDPATISPPSETGEEGARRWAAALNEGRPWYRNPWVLGGVSGVIAGVAILTLGGDETAPPVPLPGFPPPPE